MGHAQKQEQDAAWKAALRNGAAENKGAGLKPL
jgi:hypothetical protein